MTEPADIDVRYATEKDYNWLCLRDSRYVDTSWIKRCLDHQEYIIAVDEAGKIEPKGTALGYIRFSLFWGKIPYLDMIRVIEGHQRRGIGHAMFQFWQNEMKHKNHKILMTSSLQDELEPQTWHWKNGFRESGKLSLGSFDPKPEVFFIKEI